MAIPRVNLKAVKRKSGVVYQLDYRLDGSRRREVVGSDKQAAKRIQIQRQQELSGGNFSLPNSQTQSVSLQTLVDEFQREKKREIRASSSKRYQNYLDPFVTFFKDYFPTCYTNISLIKHQYINEFIEKAIEPDGVFWSNRTTNNAIKFLRSLFKFAIDREYISKNPLTNIKSLRLQNIEKKAFSQDDLEKIWDSLEEHWRDPIKFLYFTGLRKGELINLIWSNVDLSPGKEHITIESRGDWETKTGNSRVIPLHPEAVAIINRQKGRNPKYVFTSKPGKKTGTNTIYQIFKLTLQKLNLEGTLHTLRHTTISHLMMNGIHVLAVQKIVGQTDLKTTQMYTHFDEDHLRNAITSL